MIFSKHLSEIKKYSLSLLLFAGLIGYSQESGISFTLNMEHPSSHYFNVELNCRDYISDTMEFKLPSWTPGYYYIMDYAKNVVGFQAQSELGEELKWQKISKNTWRVIAGNSKTVRINYRVYAFEQSVADCYLDFKKAFICPTALFIYISGKLEIPVFLVVNPYKDWHSISTGLDKVSGKHYTYKAQNFDELYDCPILIGNHKEFHFTVDNIPYILAMENDHGVSEEVVTDDLSRIIRSTTELMGDIPYKHYTFIMLQDGRGGLEHRNSMAIFTDIPDRQDKKEYSGWLSYVAHEYFHLYNVKSIRPIALGPFDYEKENYTNMLWVSEGFTVYYEYIILNRSGQMNRRQCHENLSEAIRNYENFPGHLFQSATQSSFDAWIDFFNFRENKKNTSISYYDKGCALGLLLDLKIRHETTNQQSLDDVMRRLYHEFYKEKKRGFTDDEFRIVCENIASCDLSEIFDNYASTINNIDYPKYLAYAGLSIDTTTIVTDKIHLGARYEETEGKIIIRSVDYNSPAYEAGLSINDEITSINGHKIDIRAMDKIISTSKPGDILGIGVSHQGISNNYQVKLRAKTYKSFDITKLKNTDTLQNDIYSKWLLE